MWGQIFLTSCLVLMTSCWRIGANEKNVAIQLSPNVTIECRNDEDNGNNYPKLAHINRLRILKHNPNNQWYSIAKVMKHVPDVETSLHDAVVTGNLNNISNSFLKLQFSLATDETIGQFVCEVDGYDVGDELEHVKTKPVVIIERGVTYKDIVKVILQYKEQNKTEHVDDQLAFRLLQKSVSLLEIKENSTSTLLMKLIDRVNHFDEDHSIFAKSSVTKQEPDLHKNIISVDFSNIRNKMQHLNKEFLRLTDKQNQFIADIKSIVKGNPSQVWPTGVYSLLKPKDGCPYSPTFDWEYSSVRVTTKPGVANIDAVSNLTHLPPNTLQHDNKTDDHYVFMAMCTTTANNRGPDWPEGSYCIHAYDSCPDEFTYTAIEFGRHNNGTIKDVVVNQPHIHPNADNTRICYCCRDDGKAIDQMILPSENPFYLYRFKGQCQEVKGMVVQNEWMELDTIKDHDEYDNSDIHPDGHIKNVRLEICYYKPRV